MINVINVPNTTYGRKRFKAFMLFILFIALISLDLINILHSLKDQHSIHVTEFIEFLIFIVGSISFLYLWNLTKLEEKSKINHEKEIKKLQEDCNHWKEKAAPFINEFQSFIEHHFKAWELTEIEKDIGIFLIKGLTFKEIAQIRNVSEKTIRNQALSIYAKSGLAGRNELSAFFLEELLAPTAIKP